MIIKPKIKFNVHMATHPYGVKKNIEDKIEYVKKQDKLTTTPKKALIVGGSAGYGLASRIALAWGADADTISVSRGGAPKGSRTGSAGFWGCYWFDKLAKKAGKNTKDFFGDAFSYEMKKEVSDYIKEKYGKIDILVYSLAAGVRVNPDNGEKVKSVLKPIGKEIESFTIDITTHKKQPIKIEAATQEEIDNTVYCMGGGDWKLWIDFLKEADVLAPDFKTVAYTYVGGEVTKEIYREGTIGKAKENLEATAKEINNDLSDINGEALISVSKAIVSKASVFIPSMVVYGSALFEASLKQGIHESVIEHKYRLFKDMIYGNNKTLDKEGKLRLDALEMKDSIQNAVMPIMELFQNNPEEFYKLEGTKLFINNFYKINGFNIDSINYDEEVDIEALINK